LSFSFTKPRFILCEGIDDKAFLEALIEDRHLPEFQVRHSAECNKTQTGGNTGFRPAVKGMEALSGFDQLRALLIVADNDVLGQSFHDTQTAFTANGYIAPPTPGEIGNMKGKAVAIFMVPSADTVGDLESLSLPAIYQKWPRAKRCVPLFLKCTGAIACTGKPKWPKRSSISKAYARAAAVGFNEDDPYMGIGYLFKHHQLSPQHECFNEIANFLANFDAFSGI
jgi:hypothetical protein